MSDTYTAWDGKSYPWPPPDGWELKSDGRYWPIGQGPAATAPPPTPPPAAPAPPGPAPQPLAAPGGVPPYGAPPPGAAPPPMGAPPQKKSNTGLIVLAVLLGGFVVLVGGCIVSIALLADTATDQLETIAEEFDEGQQEAKEDISVEECEVVDGTPTARGTIENKGNEDADYSFTITFTGDDDFRLSDGSDFVDNLEPGEKIRFEVTNFELDVDGGVRCGLADAFKYTGILNN